MLRPSIVLFLPLASCSTWFFSGQNWVDRGRPVALVETTGGVEFGATTEFGVLTLGRTAISGPCRVHYFLGPTPLIESGEVKTTKSLFARAEIDLKTQAVRALDRSLQENDELCVMWTPDGTTTRRVNVQLAKGASLEGDLLRDPGQELPAGATLLCRGEGGALFAGLIAGRATLEGAPDAGRYYVFAGVDRVRELLGVPVPYPIDVEVHYRTDDMHITKPVK